MSSFFLPSARAILNYCIYIPRAIVVIKAIHGSERKTARKTAIISLQMVTNTYIDAGIVEPLSSSHIHGYHTCIQI